MSNKHSNTSRHVDRSGGISWKVQQTEVHQCYSDRVCRLLKVSCVCLCHLLQRRKEWGCIYYIRSYSSWRNAAVSEVIRGYLLGEEEREEKKTCHALTWKYLILATSRRILSKMMEFGNPGEEKGGWGVGEVHLDQPVPRVKARWIGVHVVYDKDVGSMKCERQPEIALCRFLGWMLGCQCHSFRLVTHSSNITVLLCTDFILCWSSDISLARISKWSNWSPKGPRA